MGSKERRERERDETRQRILAAARELFADRGVEAVTMREIAKRIDYTPTAIYHHFRDKNALITELCHIDFLSLAHVLLKIGRIDDPIERVRRLGLAYVEFGLTHPSQYRFMFMTPKQAYTHEEVGIAPDHPEEDAYAALRMTVADGIAAGRYRPEYEDADQLSQMVWSAVHGVVALYITKGHDAWVKWKDPRANATEVIDAMIRGITRTPAA